MTIIQDLNVYDLEKTLIASGYAMVEDYSEEMLQNELKTLSEDLTNNKHYKRALKLTKAALNSGHPNFLSGILVSMDVTFTNKVWVEWQRYHFQQIVTSQSTMHRISKFDLDEAFIEYVDQGVLERLKELQKEYNENKTMDNYLKLLYSTPAGLKLTARVTTNYLQLMTMYQQRHHHRLPEWRQFCDELIVKLPLFDELLFTNGHLTYFFHLLKSVF